MVVSCSIKIDTQKSLSPKCLRISGQSEPQVYRTTDCYESGPGSYIAVTVIYILLHVIFDMLYVTIGNYDNSVVTVMTMATLANIAAIAMYGNNPARYELL
jgi:hypothetical protein